MDLLEKYENSRTSFEIEQKVLVSKFDLPKLTDYSVTAPDGFWSCINQKHLNDLSPNDMGIDWRELNRLAQLYNYSCT